MLAALVSLSLSLSAILVPLVVICWQNAGLQQHAGSTHGCLADVQVRKCASAQPCVICCYHTSQAASYDCSADLTPLLLLLLLLQAAESASAGRHVRSQVVTEHDITRVISKVSHCILRACCSPTYGQARVLTCSTEQDHHTCPCCLQQDMDAAVA
jgi:hypothetical protein